MNHRLLRSGALLAALVVAFIGLVTAHDLADPPRWRGLVILLAGPLLFRALNRFEPPRS